MIGVECPAEFQRITFAAIMSDVNKQMTQPDKKGVSTDMHYPCLTPQNFVSPLLLGDWNG
jgi:hypothetical protein